MDKTRIFDLHADTLDRLAWPTLASDLNGGNVGYGPHDEAFATPGSLIDFLDSPVHITLRDTQAFSWCQCMAVFIPDTLDAGQSARFFDHVSATLDAHIDAHPDLFAQAKSASEIEGILGSGKTCAVLTIENGKLLAASSDMVERICRRGVAMVTLTWNAENPLGSGMETTHGLTPFGREMVSALEERRIVCDVSHLNDEGFWDFVDIARRPFAASHSNSRAVCPHPRNLTDEQFRALRDAGGICGLNYFREFVSNVHADPTPADLLRHLEHWLDLDGEDVVALGSDYDGCDVLGWLEPARKVATLTGVLEDHFGEAIARKICFENAHDFFLRVQNEG